MSKPTRYYSEKQEKFVADYLKAKKVSNSGAPLFTYGDVICDNVLIECKTKVRKSKTLTIERKWFKDIREEAFNANKSIHAVLFDFGYVADYTETYVAVRLDDFKFLMELYNKEMGN